MKLSVVTTWFRAVASLPEFHARMAAAARRFTDDYELLFVFDGTAPVPHAPDPRVRVLALPEHRGEHAARLAGIAAAHGDWIYVTPGDLEVAPESLAEFFSVAQAAPGTEVVIGCQARRRGRWSERLSGAVFYRVYNAVARVSIPANPAGCYLFTRAGAQRLLAQFRPASLFLAAVMEAGLSPRILIVDKTRRQPSAYRWGGKARLALRALRRARG